MPEHGKENQISLNGQVTETKSSDSFIREQLDNLEDEKNATGKIVEGQVVDIFELTKIGQDGQFSANTVEIVSNSKSERISSRRVVDNRLAIRVASAELTNPNEVRRLIKHLKVA